MAWRLKVSCSQKVAQFKETGSSRGCHLGDVGRRHVAAKIDDWSPLRPPCLAWSRRTDSMSIHVTCMLNNQTTLTIVPNAINLVVCLPDLHSDQKKKLCGAPGPPMPFKKFRWNPNCNHSFLSWQQKPSIKPRTSHNVLKSMSRHSHPEKPLKNKHALTEHFPMQTVFHWWTTSIFLTSRNSSFGRTDLFAKLLPKWIHELMGIVHLGARLEKRSQQGEKLVDVLVAVSRDTALKPCTAHPSAGCDQGKVPGNSVGFTFSRAVVRLDMQAHSRVNPSPRSAFAKPMIEVHRSNSHPSRCDLQRMLSSPAGHGLSARCNPNAVSPFQRKPLIQIPLNVAVPIFEWSIPSTMMVSTLLPWLSDPHPAQSTVVPIDSPVGELPIEVFAPESGLGQASLLIRPQLPDDFPCGAHMWHISHVHSELGSEVSGRNLSSHTSPAYPIWGKINMSNHTLAKPFKNTNKKSNPEPFRVLCNLIKVLFKHATGWSWMGTNYYCRHTYWPKKMKREHNNGAESHGKRAWG